MPSQAEWATKMARRYSMAVPADMARTFEEWVSADGDVTETLYQHVAPDVEGRERARLATLAMLASEGDRGGFRGRLHVLLYDDDVGGTGKSAIREWVKGAMPDSRGIGPDSSAVGLKFNANSGEPGALHKAHQGVLTIEEFGKFEREDRQATYEAMSEGYYEVTKGQVDAEFPASVRVMALSNDITRLSGPMRSRFDLAVEMDEYGESETVAVAQQRNETFRDRFVNEDGDHRPPVVPAYLSWIGAFRPDYPDGAYQTINQLYEELVAERETAGDIRAKEAYLRVAYTIAKLNRRDITPGDWVRAVEIVDPELNAGGLFAEERALLGAAD